VAQSEAQITQEFEKKLIQKEKELEQKSKEKAKVWGLTQELKGLS
jgi:hypothetical protein